MEMAMEFFWEIAKNAAKNAWNLQENRDVLKTEMLELSSQETDVKNELDKLRVLYGKKPKEEVSLWLENVKKITSEVAKIEEDSRQVRRYFFISHFALGKLVVAKIEEVVKLKEKGQFSEGLIADILPESGSMPTTKLVGRMTAERILEHIWDSLTDNEVSIIGVYGMGGVGKTTIMTHVYNKIRSSGIFGIAIWVTVSHDSSIERLQNSIARAIGLELSYEEDEMKRSMTLFQAFKGMEKALEGKKFVIILDDMWKPFSLEKVGIPEGNASKIILTTRSKNVCRGMKCQKKFEVEVLSREESWELFKERIGGDVVLCPEVEPIAKLVIEECGGLPLGIITVASAMREKGDVSEWRNALEELKCSMTDEIEGMDDQVFPILKFSYDRLKSERIRSCFLYCALFPEDYVFSADELIAYWITEGLIDDMGDRGKEEDKGKTILNGLIDACMLVRKFNHHIVMHDLIRDLVIGITRKSPRFVVKAGIRIRGSIGAEEFTEDAEKISLMRNEIKMLSGQPNCPKLSTLFLQDNPLSGNISDEFFNRMNSLRVLDLSQTGIEYVPVSVSNLENLHALLLKNCRRLREIPSLAKLKRLRFLNISYAEIVYMPASVSDLENLSVLILNDCERLREIPSLAKLKRLRVLHIRLPSIKELPHGMECLVNLEELYVHSREWIDYDLYVNFGHWKCLKRFHLNSKSGNFKFDEFQMPVLRCNLIGKESYFVPPDSILTLFMDGCELSSLPCLSRLDRLQECNISCCSMEWLLPIGDNNTLMSLPSLKSLFLEQLPSFRGMCEGVLPSGSFACLRYLTVYRCRLLENLMSFGLFQHLQYLEQIIIEGCSEMIEVIHEEEAMVEEGDNNTILLPNLEGLYLRHLGKLKRVCKRVIICPSLIEIFIVGCHQLKKIPLSLGNSTSVVRGEINGSKEWWDALEWDDPNTKTRLQHLFQEDRGIKRKAGEELQQIASTSRQR